ncbi:MAG: biotin--[acetyl-CoA-carboxylase] ligase [Planctomycetota bacterium]
MKCYNQLLLRRLRTRLVGREIRVLDSVPSTNDAAAAAFRKGAGDGLVIVADAQTRGRGRMGRAWHSPAGKGLWFSVLLPVRPGISPTLVTAAASLAVCRVVRRTTGLPALIRWPNDIVIRGRKAAGILVEGKRGGGRDALVLGIGVNVSQRRRDFPLELRNRATSLSAAAGRVPDRTRLLRGILRALDRLLETLPAGSPALLAAWQRLSEGKGRAATIRWRNRLYSGIVEFADPVRGIILATPEGRRGIFPTRETTVVTLENP